MGGFKTYSGHNGTIAPVSDEQHRNVDSILNLLAVGRLGGRSLLPSHEPLSDNTEGHRPFLSGIRPTRDFGSDVRSRSVGQLGGRCDCGAVRSEGSDLRSMPAVRFPCLQAKRRKDPSLSESPSRRPPFCSLYAPSLSAMPRSVATEGAPGWNYVQSDPKGWVAESTPTYM